MKKIIFLSVCILSTLSIFSQDQTFGNSNQNLLYTNPSFAGSNGGIRNQFIYRNQWPNYSGSPISLYNGLDAYVKKLHGGLALSLMTSNQSGGTYKRSEINLIYAPVFECKESGFKIIPSIQLTAFKKEVDLASLTFGQWPWTGSAIPASSKTNFDASAGLLFNYKSFYAGGTVFHINQPDEGLLGPSKLPARFSFNSSYNLPINEKTLVNFSAVYTNQQRYNTIQIAANAIFLKHIVTGIGYVNKDLVFFNAGYRNNYFSVTLGYDIVVSKLAGNTLGAVQLAAAFRLGKKPGPEVPKNFENW